jgi:L-malate glycosyltransferase
LTELVKMSPIGNGHINHVAHLVLGLPVGGTEGLVDQMLRHPLEGFYVSALCLDEIGALGEQARNDGLEVTLIQRGYAGVNWSIPLAIARHVRNRSIDILHCHHYTPWFYGILSRLMEPKLRVIFTEHGRLYPDIPSAKKRIFNRFMIPLTHSVTAVSPAVAMALHKIEGFSLDRIKIIYNGVDATRFAGHPDRQNLRLRLGLRHDFTYFILCSRLDPIKWIDGLLRAFRIVVDETPGTGLLLVGDGPEKEKIRQEISDLGLESHVSMPGYRTDIPDWLAAADVFVLSSLSEGTSVSLIESMAAGIPSLATRVGGNEYVIEEGNTGLLVPPRDVNALASGMMYFAKDADARREFGKRARKRFEERYQLARMFEEYEVIYRDLVKR